MWSSVVFKINTVCVCVEAEETKGNNVNSVYCFCLWCHGSS